MLTKRFKLSNFLWLFTVIILITLTTACTNKEDLVKVFFETNEGTTIDPIDINLEDDEITLPEPTKEGYTFLGWYVDEALTDKLVFSDFLGKETMTLYAKWKVDNQILSLTFDTQGGSSNKTVQYTENEIPEYYIPTKEGYVFSGWYTDLANESTKYLFNESLNENQTVYAKWEIRSNQVLSVVFSDDMVFEFNVDGQNLPDVSELVPANYANNIESYYKDDQLSYAFDPLLDDFSEIQTLYARIDDKRYVFYEDISIEDADILVRNAYNNTFALKDGILYGETNQVAQRNSTNNATIYKPIRSLYDTRIQGNIKSIDFVRDEWFLIELNSNDQYYGYIEKSGDSYYHIFEHLNLTLKLNENETVTQAISLDLGTLFLTSEERVLFDSIGFSTSEYEFFGVIDVTGEFNLDENEQFDQAYNSLSVSTVKTTKGRIFTATHNLATHDLFDVVEDGSTFTEYSILPSTTDQLFYLDFDLSDFSYLTIKGEYFISSHLNVYDIFETIELEEDEFIIDFVGDVLLTNENRFIYLTGLMHLEDITPSFIEESNNLEFIFNIDHTELLIKTEHNKIYHYTYSFTDLTEQFNQLNLTFEDVSAAYDFTIVKNNEKYVINDRLKIELYDIGFSKFKIDGPYDVGQNVAINSYENETYEMSGYLNDFKQAVASSVKMPNSDIMLHMLIHDIRFSYVFLLHEDGTRYDTFELTKNQQITKEDLLMNLPDTLDIDYVLYDNDVVVELPFTVKETHGFIYLTVYTKPKDEAISVEINYVSGDLSFGESIMYGLPGDTLQDITKDISFYDFDVAGIYIDEDLTIEYMPNEVISTGVTLYVELVEMPYYELTTHINEDATFTREFKNYIQVSKFQTMLSIRGYFGMKGLDQLIIDNIYLDAEKTIPITETMTFESDVEIWVDLVSNYTIELIEINPFGDAIMYDRLNTYPDDSVMGESLYDYLEVFYSTKNITIYLDKDLTVELTPNEYVAFGTKQLFYTLRDEDSIPLTVHMYDQDDHQFIETITFNYHEGLIDFYFPTVGYKDVYVYTNDTFTDLFDGDITQGLELYAIGNPISVNLVIIDVDKNVTYEAKFPINEQLGWAAIGTYLTQQDDSFDQIEVYLDSDLQEKAYNVTVIEDLTIYVKRDYQIRLNPTTIVVTGLYEDTIEAFLMENKTINLDFMKHNILTNYSPLAYLKVVRMYSDLEKTVEIGSFVSGEVETVYVDITEPVIYTMTFVDAQTQSVLGTTTLKEGLSFNLSSRLRAMLNIPYEFSQAYIYDAYLDLEMTEPAVDGFATEDRTYYVDFRLPETYEITYQFEGDDIDDLVLMVDENDILENHLIFEKIADYYGSNVSINYSIFDQMTNKIINNMTPNQNMTVTVEINVIEMVTIKFIYDLPTGASFYEYRTFDKGARIGDSIFFGMLFTDPYGYEAYFYMDEEMTDGSLTFIADQDETVYVKVVKKS